MTRGPMTAADLRRWAMQCGTQAHDPMMSGDERERLLKMQESLLDLASTEDWLNGTAQFIQLSNDGRKKSPSQEGLKATRR
jgi:hypothetical protein